MTTSPHRRGRQIIPAQGLDGDPWVPFVEFTGALTDHGMAEASGVASPSDARAGQRRFLNHLYEVTARPAPTYNPGWPPMVELSIKRRDKLAGFFDWRHFQWVKNEVMGLVLGDEAAGNECEGVMLFPGEARLVDTANQFYVFAFTKPGPTLPFGFLERLVAEGDAFGTVQRPFPPDKRPADTVQMTEEEVQRRMQAYQARPGGDGDAAG